MTTRNCIHCSKPFQIRPQGLHAKFCSTSCRVANHKLRKRSVDPKYETRIPVYIIYEDGREYQTDISRAELSEIISSESLAGSTVRSLLFTPAIHPAQTQLSLEEQQ
jgi:hypothetical protein